MAENCRFSKPAELSALEFLPKSAFRETIIWWGSRLCTYSWTRRRDAVGRVGKSWFATRLRGKGDCRSATNVSKRIRWK